MCDHIAEALDQPSCSMCYTSDPGCRKTSHAGGGGNPSRVRRGTGSRPAPNHPRTAAPGGYIGEDDYPTSHPGGEWEAAPVGGGGAPPAVARGNQHSFEDQYGGVVDLVGVNEEDDAWGARRSSEQQAYLDEADRPRREQYRKSRAPRAGAPPRLPAAIPQSYLLSCFPTILEAAVGSLLRADSEDSTQIRC